MDVSPRHKPVPVITYARARATYKTFIYYRGIICHHLSPEGQANSLLTFISILMGVAKYRMTSPQFNTIKHNTV